MRVNTIHTSPQPSPTEHFAHSAGNPSPQHRCLAALRWKHSVDIRLCELYRIETASGIEYATQIGTIEFKYNDGNVEKTFTLSNTEYLESCTTGLISRESTDSYSATPKMGMAYSLTQRQER
jgi:hypothetical protein